jgi:telomerase Cajal body protein 1
MTSFDPQNGLPSSTTFPSLRVAVSLVSSCRRCPDGSTALAQSENRTFHFLDLYVQLIVLSFHSTSHDYCRPAELLSTSLPHITTIPRTANTSFTRPLPQPSPILDFAWYPQATVQNPASFCFVASVRDTPVRLVDAGDGRVSVSLISNSIPRSSAR